jgi:hypothetical protein
MRGGRKGGLVFWELTGSLSSDIVTLPSRGGGTIKEGEPTNPKLFIGHAIDEQQSSMAFCEGRFLSGQQSCMRSVEDMGDVSTDFTLIAAPLPVGNTATDRAIKRIRIVRPICMGRPCTSKVADFRALRSNDDFARVVVSRRSTPKNVPRARASRRNGFAVQRSAPSMPDAGRCRRPGSEVTLARGRLELPALAGVSGANRNERRNPVPRSL